MGGTRRSDSGSVSHERGCHHMLELVVGGAVSWEQFVKEGDIWDVKLIEVRGLGESGGTEGRGSCLWYPSSLSSLGCSSGEGKILARILHVLEHFEEKKDWMGWVGIE